MRLLVLALLLAVPVVLAQDAHAVPFDSLIQFNSPSVVPEPGTGLLVMAGILGLAIWKRRRA
jgi:hypothetical protein